MIPSSNIQQELQSLQAPKLSALLGKNPFRMPANYLPALQAQAQAITESEQQLIALTPRVQQLAQQNAFALPNNYFADLKELVQLGISENLSDIQFSESVSAITTKKATAFTVPPNYFTSLSQSLQAAVQNTAIQSPTIDAIAALPAFTTPSNYFETNKVAIWQAIKLAPTETPALHYAGTEKPFDVPDNYFADLKQQLLAQVKSLPSEQANNTDTALTTAPLLASISKTNTQLAFVVPANYFNTLKSSVLQAIRKENNSSTPVLQQPTPKVINFPYMLRYVAAVAAVIAIAFFVQPLMQTTTTTTQTAQAGFTVEPIAEVAKWLNNLKYEEVYAIENYLVDNLDYNDLLENITDENKLDFAAATRAVNPSDAAAYIANEGLQSVEADMITDADIDFDKLQLLLNQ